MNRCLDDCDYGSVLLYIYMIWTSGINRML